MVLEHAVLQVVPGQETSFEEAFAAAKNIIAASPGFRSLSLSRCLEHDRRYLLLVEWDSLADHVEGFRTSPGYDKWRRLLHHFYNPFPEVVHYRTIQVADGGVTTPSHAVPSEESTTGHRSREGAAPTDIAVVGGLDGCAGGWVMVTTSVDEGAVSSVDVIADLSQVLHLLNAGELAAAVIDIPIGLPDRDPRPCDLAARKIIGPRASSVFPAPLRSVLGSTSYEEACARSIAASGKSMSRQAFAILPKIESVDRIMTRELQDRFFEVHPELSFTMMAGRPMDHHKATPEGRAERLALLRREIADLDDHVHSRMARSSPDDVLDAFAAAWSARRRLAGSHVQLGGESDGRGLRMEMIA